MQAHVWMMVYDLLGREVGRLVDEVKQPGSHTFGFDGCALASGVYFYRIVAGGFTATRAMVLVQ